VRTRDCFAIARRTSPRARTPRCAQADAPAFAGP